MKYFVTLLLFCGLILVISTCDSGSDKPVTLKTNKDTVSYIIGGNMGRSLKDITDEIDLDVLISSIHQHLDGTEIEISQQESQRIMRDFSTKIRKQQDEKRNAEGQKNLEEGQKFLEENKTKEGVVTTESGLQYIVLKQGDGPKPTKTDKVKVHYVGTLLDGTEFDSSISRGKPLTFAVTGVIKGWTEALLLMNVGSKYKLFIPSDLAYGPRGSGPKIGANSTLIFEVELLDIEKPVTK